MNTINACVTVCCSSCLLFSCASKTFTQEGVVTTERICYEDKCYTTIRWQDGRFSNVEDTFLPDAETVYRHCHIENNEKNENVVCSREIYEQPIALFNKDYNEIIRAKN